MGGVVKTCTIDNNAAREQTDGRQAGRRFSETADE
jgi:hypothetical protein